MLNIKDQTFGVHWEPGGWIKVLHVSKTEKDKESGKGRFPSGNKHYAKFWIMSKCQQVIGNDAWGLCRPTKYTVQVSCCRKRSSLTAPAGLITLSMERPFFSWPALSQKLRAEGYLFWPILVGYGVLLMDDFGSTPLGLLCCHLRIFHVLCPFPSLFSAVRSLIMDQIGFLYFFFLSFILFI